MKKVIAEFFGTCIFTFIGCSVIVFLNYMGVKNSEAVLPVALTFGLALSGIYYAFGSISGAHLNPAVSLASYLSGSKDFTAGDLFLYMLAQISGALVGICILAFVIMQCDMGGVASVGLGANYYGSGGISINIIGTAVVEVLLTFIFVLVFLNASNSGNTKCNAGFVIGATFAGCYSISFLLTGGSLNPARSLAPAIVMFGFGSTKALEQVLVFVIVPLIAAAFSALVYTLFSGKGQKVEIVAPELPKKEEPAPKPTSVKKSATKAKPTTPSRFEKADEKPKRKGFFSGEPRDKKEASIKKDSAKDTKSADKKES